MIFSSMLFLWAFLPIVLFFYYIVKDRYKNIILLISSLIFYAWGEPKYILLMLFSIFINYIFGILIDKYRKHDKKILTVAIVSNLAILGYFKYFNFISSIINNIFAHTVIDLRTIILPIGISFYTFQILSYVIDLYRKKIKVQKNIFDLALYVSLFPQLIAGPIVRYKSVEKEIKKRNVDVESFALGVKKFIYGLSKKVLFANNLAYVVDNLITANVNTPLMWFIAICYTLQLYFDFSGYSDMAIGLGKMFGFNFPKNFDLPYISTSITEFWRRWHISLSTWFKEYLYIPLGGNRKGKVRTYINLLIVFFATGLWHGASFNFIAWGLYYGIFLIIEKMFLLEKLNNNKFKFLNHIYVMLIVIVGWVIFRVDTLRDAVYFVKMLFIYKGGPSYALLPTIFNLKLLIVLIFAILCSGPLQMLFKKLDEKYDNKLSRIYKNNLELIILPILMIICILELASSTYNPFIYYRF